MTVDTRNSSSDGRDDWLAGAGEFDWGDDPPSQSRGGTTRPPAGDTEPLWPGSEAPHPDEATIRRRRAIGLVVGLAVVGALIVFAVIAFGGSDDTPTETPTTTAVETTATPPANTTPAQTTTTPATPTLTVTLEEGVTLREGSTGEDVEEVQEALIELGLLEGPADGDFGAATTAAVGEFQRTHGLPDDGVVGPRTAEEMNAALADEATASSTP